METSSGPPGDELVSRPSEAPALVFRELDADAIANPLPGEIVVAPMLPEDHNRRDMAALVLERALAGLPRGVGEIRRLVVRRVPTLDDLLATTIVVRLLSGHATPPGLHNFARYSAMAREGLKPGDVPLELSLAGAFLALCNSCDGDLTDPAISRRFLADWSPLAETVLRAAESAIDPFRVSLIADRPEFARERAYLAGDHKVYVQDVARGERWYVRLPDGPVRGAGLLLRQPRSALFKYWCREDPEAPGGRGYVFLAVDWGQGEWVFSTNPVDRLPIRTLAEVLQKAELVLDPAHATGDPWFDGKPFKHTLVGSPRSGTRLPDDQVMRILKTWLRARSVDRPSRRTVIAASATLLAGSVGVLAWRQLRPVSPIEPVPDRRPIGPIGQTQPVPPPQKGEINLHVLTVGVSKYRPGLVELPCAVRDARAIAAAFEKLGHGRPFDHVYCRPPLVDPDSTRDGIYDAIKQLHRELDREDQERRKVHRNDLAILYFAGHGQAEDADHFYFLPSDYDPNARAIESTAVHFNSITDTLAKLPCSVLVLMDACGSGPITKKTLKFAVADSRPIERGGRSLDALRGDDLELEKIRSAFRESPPKLMALAAATSVKSAYESSDWGHSAFGLALLERLSGELLFEGGSETRRAVETRGIVTLEDLQDYLKMRVKEITRQAQKVVPFHPGDDTADNIPIAFVERPTFVESPRVIPLLERGRGVSGRSPR